MFNIEPPFECIFCGSHGPFTSEEHIVPHSLGNDLVVLAKGWVCDACNHSFSEFESRALYASILGMERCRMGVTTKAGRPAHSKTHGVSWFAEPSAPRNVVSTQAQWEKVPHLLSPDGTTGQLLLPVHDQSNKDIGCLLLKIGVEIIAPLLRCGTHEPQYDLSEAKRHLVSRSNDPWPYFLLRDRNAGEHLISVFAATPEEHDYIRDCGFDIFLHEIDSKPILFFGYGAFFAAISLVSRCTAWREILLEWHVSHVGCPAEYAHLSA